MGTDLSGGGGGRLGQQKGEKRIESGGGICH